jgi:hypothetical protein
MEKPRFNGWQNAESLHDWEQQIERADAETIRQQMERQRSPQMEVNRLLALKILVGMFILGAMMAYAASHWQGL